MKTPRSFSLCAALLLALSAVSIGRAQPVAHWAFDGDLLDSAGSSDGQFLGGAEPIFVTGVDGTPGGALSFDGVDDVVQIEPGFELDVTASWSIVFWFRAAVAGQVQKYLIAKSGDSQYAIIWGYVPDTLELFVPGAIGEDPRPSSAMPLADTEWHQIAYVSDGFTLAGYLDGEQIFLADVVFELNLFTGLWYIGAANPTVNFVEGFFDDVQIYDVPLDDREVADLYEEPVEVECPAEGDTTCTGLTVDGPPGNTVGNYVLTATADDASGDTVLYTFTADDGLGTVITVGPQTSGTANLGLGEGNWIVTVTVDDDLLCGDVADTNTCSEVVGVSGFPELVAHWPFDGNLADVAGAHDGTLVNDIEPFFVDGYDGTPEGAVLLDGLDDYVLVPDAPDLVLGETFTLALWFQAASTDQSNKYLFSHHDAGGMQYAIIYEYVDDTIEFFAPQRISGDDPRGASHMPLADTGWHHIAYTSDGMSFAGYLDGFQVFSVELPFILNPFRAPWYIGAARADAVNATNGAFDDVRIYSIALTAEEIVELVGGDPGSCPEQGDTHATALDIDGSGAPGTYTVTATATDDSGDAILYTFRAERDGGPSFTVGPQEEASVDFELLEGTWQISVTVDDDPLCFDVADDAVRSTEVVAEWGQDLLAHWELDGSLDDTAGTNDGAFLGDLEPIFVDGFDGTAGGAVLFDGIDDRIEIPYSAELALTDRFTLALWFRPDSLDLPQTYLLSRNGGGGQYAIIYEYLADQVEFFAGSYTGDDPRPETGLPVVEADWHHVAYTYDGTTLTGYLDGIPAVSRQVAFRLSDTFVARWWIGAANSEGAASLAGAIDDVRIYSYALGAEEILDITGLENPCPEEGDTHITSVDIDGPFDDPGVYTVTVSATDDSGDPDIYYTVSASPGFGAPIVVGPQLENVLFVPLETLGEWELTIVADDDLVCPDRAADGARTETVILGEAESLVGHWEFDGDLTDSEGFNDGFLAGAEFPSFVAGHDGTAEGAVSLDGIDDYVQIPQAPELDLTRQFTLAMWFRAGSTDQFQKYLLSHHDEGGMQYAIIYEYVDDTVEFFAPLRASGDDPRPVSAMLLSDTEWHHIAYTNDGATFSGYVDGVQIFSVQLPFVLSPFPAPWYVGAARADAVNATNGAFDDVRIYNYALTAAEVAELAGEVVVVGPVFKRGDVDGNGMLEITDPINNLSFQFLGTFTPPCRDAADFDDNGKIEITDPIANLSHQFLGQAPPPPPGKDTCGEDPTADDPTLGGDLGCEEYPEASCQ